MNISYQTHSPAPFCPRLPPNTTCRCPPPPPPHLPILWIKLSNSFTCALLSSFAAEHNLVPRKKLSSSCCCLNFSLINQNSFKPFQISWLINSAQNTEYLVFAILNNDRLKVVLDKACVGESTQPDDVFVWIVQKYKLKRKLQDEIRSSWLHN